MGTELAKAYVQIVPSAQGIKGGITQALGGEADSAGIAAGQSFGGKMMSTLKTIIVAAGIGKMLASSISEGAALEQSLGGIETLFKNNADTVKKMASEAYRTAGLSANEYMETVTSFSASLLQGLAGDTAKAAEISDMAITDMADNSNKMGTSMELIQNAYQGFAKQNYTMLDNLKLGYGGTKTEMERLLADAQKISGVKYDIGNLSDVYSAIHVIQGELDITGTTAKEAASTISGSMAAMKSAFKNVLANLTLGQDMEDSLAALTETTTTFLFQNLLPAVGNIFKALPEAMNTAFTVAVRSLSFVKSNAAAIVQQGVQFVSKLLEGMISNLPYLIEGVVGIAMSMGQALLEYDWSGAVQSFIEAIRSHLDIAAGEILGTDGNIVGAVLNSITTNLPKVLQGGVTLISGLVNGIASALPAMVAAALSTVVAFADCILAQLPSILEAGKNVLLSVVGGIQQALPEIIAIAAKTIASLIASLISHLPEILATGFDLIVSLIKGIGNAMPGIIEAAGTAAHNIWETICDVDWLQLGKDIIGGLINGIGAMAGALWEAATNIAKSAFNAICSFFGIASPSKLMRDEVGKFIPAGIAVGIENNTKPISNAMRNLTDLTTSTLQTDLAVQLSKSNALAVPAYDTLGGAGSEGMVFQQTIYSHDSLSPYEMSRAAEDMIAQERWKIK